MNLRTPRYYPGREDAKLCTLNLLVLNHVTNIEEANKSQGHNSTEAYKTVLKGTQEEGMGENNVMTPPEEV